MDRIRSILLVVLALVLLTVMVLTWGSIASFAIVLGLVISGSMALLRKALENRDENDYYTDDN